MKAKGGKSAVLFESSQIELLSLNDLDGIPEIEETGNTFEENAAIKAHKVFEKFRMPVVADDSGLAAEQLNGNPGSFFRKICRRKMQPMRKIITNCLIN